MTKLRTIIAILEIVTSFLVVFSVCAALYLRFRHKRNQAGKSHNLK
ncbi:MAG: hypothetical protein ACREBD_12650 [Blastocatellia bacterium]